MQIIVRDESELDQRLQALGNRIRATWDGPIDISFKPHVERRSLSQNSLYWKWLGMLAVELSTGMKILDKDMMHDMLRYRFLGTESVTILGDEVVRLPSTTALSRPDMYSYMASVEAWATDMGVMLPIPGENEYSKYRDAAR